MTYQLKSQSEAIDDLNYGLHAFQNDNDRSLPRFSIDEEYDDDWWQLIQASNGFADLEPWQWLNSDQVLVLDLPNHSERVYCCVLGQMGDEYGLVAYVGDQGLAMIHRLFAHAEKIDRPPLAQAFHLSLCRPGTYPEEDRVFLSVLQMGDEPEEHLPMLRVQTPGYAPWIPQGEEILLFAEIIEEVTQVAFDYQELAEAFPFYEQPKWFYRKYEVGEGSTKKAVDDQIVPASGHQEWKDAEPLVSVLELQRIKKNTRQNENWIELGGAFAPFSVGEQDGNRPTLPWLQLTVDHFSGYVMHYELLENHAALDPCIFVQSVQEFLLKTIDKVGERPSGLLVNQQELYHSLVLLCKKLGILCKQSSQMHMFEETWDQLLSAFDDPPMP
ncbi:hypothetical protein M3N64_10105 [Sporolactobacillus sp. CPB3-1]|uniref:SMI1/KNR4 family protein n=1 Tax=Sporolactobacillus mangiferae TaxID=2940498 RepID=A0ABT0MDA6_9BACL|nr:hypothetical protein [Sporolactobacillus mangiferae]MCL1632290.1 hypothetical protein [Sporolactobacillus mangiferae]